MKRALFTSSIAAIFAVIGGASAADYTFTPSETVATNFGAFYSALTGTGTYNDGTYDIDSTFAAEHPQTTRNALGQILMGSSDSNTAGATSYSGVASAVDTYMGLTGAIISRDTLGVDVSAPLDGEGHIAAYAGANYIAGATSMADADMKLDSAIAGIEATKQDLIDSSHKLDASLIAVDSTHNFVTDDEKTAWNGKQDAITSSSKLDGTLISDNSIGADQLADVIDNNLLNAATTSSGLAITAGTESSPANIALNVVSTGGLEETTNGLQIKVKSGGGVATTANGLEVKNITTAMIKSDAIAKNGLSSNENGSESVLATTKSVVGTISNQAENATYTPGTSATNTSGAATLNGAIASLDSAIGNRGTLSTTNNHLTTTGTIVANLNALDSAIGNTLFSGANASGAANLTAAVNALDAEIGADTDYGTSPINGVSASNSIKANVATVNNALGDVSTHAVNGSSATDLSTAVKDLNTNMNNVLGGVYKADGTFDNTVLMNTTTQNGFETGATDLSDALKKYADNVQAATGTTFAADGSFTNAYAKPTAVDYDGLDNSQSIVSAVSQLDKNIGTAVTTAYNGVAANKTVNENISAVNATIGDITTLAAGKGSTGNALTNGTGTAAADVVTALNNIDATLGQIHGLKNGNSHLKANSNLANGTTVEQHLVSLDDAIGNRNISSANAAINTATASNMSAAMETTGNLIGSMDFDGTQYLAKVSNLTDAVRTLDNNIERVENRLEKVEYNLKSGLAAVSALSALVPNARDCGDTQLSVGTGVYADRVGVAVGGFHYFNDHVLFNAGASYGGTRDWAFRAGLTFGI